MAELRSVNPRALKPNPDNPRKTPVPKEMDQQLAASIKAIGLLQPPVVREIDDELVIRAGDRRRKAAIAAGLKTIDVYVLDGPEDIDPMATMSENLVRVGMNPVDTWRGIDRLEQKGWNEQAIADALALSVRTVNRLKLLGKLHPPMLDLMAKGSMPNDEQLRTIANASLEDQAQVWSALRPKKGVAVNWWDIARALSKPRIPFSAARFDETLAEQFGVIWHDDLFAPAGEDSRYTTNAEAFFGAQEAWMRENLPSNGTVLTISENGSPVLPKGATQIWSKPGEHDRIGHFVDPHSGEIKTITYRPPEPKEPSQGKKGEGSDNTVSGPGDDSKSRPDLTQKGQAMIGDFRTDALHQALREVAIDDTTLVALLALALAASNVSVHTGLDGRDIFRDEIAEPLIEGGVLTSDHDTIRSAARQMLTYTLSCRANMSDSGVAARIAGVTTGADTFLPTMATDEFLKCLSRQALERSASAEGLRVESRVKDTRAGLVARFKDATWHFAGARFALTDEEMTNKITSPGRYVHARAVSSYPTDERDDEALDNETGDPLDPEGEASRDPGVDDEPYPVAAE